MLWNFVENPKYLMLYPRSIEPNLKHHLARGKSILLLGPRQTGKTTLLCGMPPTWACRSSPQPFGSATRRTPHFWPAKSGPCPHRSRAAGGRW